jgi:hypothetical protein
MPKVIGVPQDDDPSYNRQLEGNQVQAIIGHGVKSSPFELEEDFLSHRNFRT